MLFLKPARSVLSTYLHCQLVCKTLVNLLAKKVVKWCETGAGISQQDSKDELNHNLKKVVELLLENGKPKGRLPKISV